MTRADVARLAGTSTAVVSYVINGGPRRVSEERRQRVLDAVAVLGYRPNDIARSLSSRSSRTIGMVVPTVESAWIAEFVSAIEDAVAGAGHLLLLGCSQSDHERETAHVSSFLDRRVEGIVLLGPARNETVALADDAGVPLLVIDARADDDRGRSISFDQRATAAMLTNHLLGHGHQRVACVTGPSEWGFSGQHLQGWTDAVRGAGLDPARLWHVSAPFTLEGGASALGALVVDPLRLPTAVFCASDELARGVLHAAAVNGLGVPGDLAVACAGGTRASRFAVPSLTSVRWPLPALAFNVVATLLGVSDAADIGDSSRTQLVLGDSCGPH